MYNQKYVYIASCIGIAFFGVSFIVMGSVLPSLTDKYMLDELASASLVTFLPIGILLGSLIFGPIVDRFGYKNLLILSTITLSLGLCGLSFFDRMNLLRFFIFLIGLGGGILNGVTNALVSEIYEGRDRASKLSLLGAFYGVGALLIPLLVSFLSKIYTYEVILRLAAVFLLLSTLYFIVVKFPQPKFQQGFPVKEALQLIKEPVLLLFSFILFFQSGLEGLCNNWTTSYLAAEITIEPSKLTLTLASFVIGMTLTRLIYSYIVHKVCLQCLLSIGLIVSFIGLFILYFVTTFWMACFALLLLGAGLAGVYPVMLSYIGSVYNKTSGTAIGIAMFIALSGNTFFNYILGFVTKEYRITVLPLFLIACLLMQTCLILKSFKYLKKEAK